MRVAALYDVHGMDVERAIREIRASDWWNAEAFVAENLLVPVARDDAIEHFEAGRA